MLLETYQDRATRDARYKQLLSEGWKKSDLRRRVAHNQLIHPMYVNDAYSAEMDTGPGNTHYRTFFATLYIIEESPSYR